MPVDIFRVPFGAGGVAARFAGHPRRMVGEISIDVGGLVGRIPTEITRDDLEEWQGVLDSLDGGYEARWRSDEDAPAVSFHRADWGKWRVTVRASEFSLAFTTSLSDEWFETSYRQIAKVFELFETS
ncbi:DUF5959 family protein [Promicromonospora sp. NPDC090134]|uniref:DUF5959 family protein n=1 Tax=Promicromonospora sp. NPDC090134 TaxID=3364408 RepID=UPI003821A99F